MQGNRLRDDGPGASPRFTTTATVQEYSPLDQYLMGFRAPEEVPQAFLVSGSSVFASRLPRVAVSFNGQRQDISVAAQGRRTPDSTSGRATADTALRLSTRLSTLPAVGVFAGNTISAALSIQRPAPTLLTITLTTQTGAATPDPTVTIPAGATSVNFNLTGVQADVDRLVAHPADSRYDTAESRVQALAGPDSAQLTVVSIEAQSVTLSGRASAGR